MYFLFDIGGTKMRLALSRDGIKFDEPRILNTPKTFDAGIELLRVTAREFARGEKITAAGGGIAGSLTREKESIVSAPNLQGWIQKPFSKQLSEALDAPVFIDNDTAIVGLGEAAAGAGKGHSLVVYITVSTGVNGVRIVDGRIDRSAFGFEIGHQVIDVTSALQSPETPGHLESMISGAAFEKKYNKKPYEVLDEVIWDEAAKILAYGVNNTILHWSPDIVVIGGSMMKKIGIHIHRVEHHLKRVCTSFPEIPILSHAELGDIGGLHGALVFVKQEELGTSSP